MKNRYFVAIALLGCAACSSSDKSTSDSPKPDPGAVDDGCERGVLESDLALSPMTGPKVDGSGVLMAPEEGGYVVSSTFLRLRPGAEARKRFNDLVAPIVAGLPGRSGLEAFQLGLSAKCETARTFSVWREAEAMYDFVGSEEHIAAVDAVGEVSRGGSVVVHWSAATADEASWDQVTKVLATSKGPFY